MALVWPIVFLNIDEWMASCLSDLTEAHTTSFGLQFTQDVVKVGVPTLDGNAPKSKCRLLKVHKIYLGKASPPMLRQQMTRTKRVLRIVHKFSILPKCV